MSTDAAVVAVAAVSASVSVASPAAAVTVAAGVTAAAPAATASSTNLTIATPPAVTATTTAGKKRKAPKSADGLRSAISIALICQSNLNRSMEAHWVLQERGNFRAYSFGAGSKVRLPGETIDRPHVYEFGTEYDVMYKDLERKNRARYTKNGMLQMLDRDRQLKASPERWQDHYDRYANDEEHKRRKQAEGVVAPPSNTMDDDAPKPRHFDIIITYEKRVYDIVQADVEARGSNPSLSRNLPTHLLNIDTTDNHAEAAVSADLTLKLVQAIYEHAKDEDDADEETNGDAEANGDDADDADLGEEDWVDKIDEIIDEFERTHSKEVGHTVLFY